MHRTSKILNGLYAGLPRCFSLFCLSFGCDSKHHNRCNIHLKSESITGQAASKSVIMTKLPGSSWTVVFVLRTKVFANAVLERYSQTAFTKTVRILGTGSRFPPVPVCLPFRSPPVLPDLKSNKRAKEWNRS